MYSLFALFQPTSNEEFRRAVKNATVLSQIRQWDVSKITDFSSFLVGHTPFNEVIMSCWDTSSATTMRRMFQNCSSFKINISSWNVSSVVDMSAMFDGCRLFDRDLSSWDVSNVRTRCVQCEDDG